MRAWVHESRSPWGPRTGGSLLRCSVPPAPPPTLHSSCLYQGLSPGFLRSSSPFAGSREGEATAVRENNSPGQPDRHKAREEAAVANQIRMRTQLRGGDPGLAGQMQAGRAPLLGEVEKIAAWHLAFRLSCPRGRIRMGPLPGRTWAVIIPAAIPQFRHSIPVSTLSKQTHSSRHWFSHSGWDPVAVISGCRLRKAEPQLLHKLLALWDSQARVLVTLSPSPPISFILQEWAPQARCRLPVLPERPFRRARV